MSLIMIKRSAPVSLTSAQILALHTTPVTLVGAPGANKVLVPANVYCKLTYGSAAYTNAEGDQLALGYGTGTPLITYIPNSEFLGKTSSQHRWLRMTEWYTNETIDLSAAANQPLVLSCPTAYADGNSGITLQVYYYIVNLI
jgi:hypothetical protein